MHRRILKYRMPMNRVTRSARGGSTSISRKAIRSQSDKVTKLFLFCLFLFFLLLLLLLLLILLLSSFRNDLRPRRFTWTMGPSRSITMLMRIKGKDRIGCSFPRRILKAMKIILNAAS